MDLKKKKTFIFSLFRMTPQVITRRFCSLSVGVKTNSLSLGSKLIQQNIHASVQLWKIACYLLNI